MRIFRPAFARQAWFLLLFAAFGCKGMFGSAEVPDDPLFIIRKPMEAKGEQKPPVPIAGQEPTPPLNPYYAEDSAPLLVSAPRP